MVVRHPRQNNRTGTDFVVSDPELPDHRNGQLTLNLGHIPSLVEADFIVSAGNQLAFEHIMAFPHWSAPLTLVTGPAKSGKSHLARIWMKRAKAHAALPDELEALAGEGGTQPTLIEDVDRRDYYENALFHFLNQSMRDQRPVLMTARQLVGQWPYKTADVLSRARLAAHFQVQPPDDIQLSHMLVKLFDDRQIHNVDPKIIAYLVARMERSTEEAVILVALMDKLALTRRTKITRSIAAEALSLRAEYGNGAAGVDEENE